MFAPWVGAIIPPKSELIITCYPNEEEEVISRLARIGYEKIIGYTYGINDWQSEDRNIDVIESVDSSEVLLYNV